MNPFQAYKRQQEPTGWTRIDKVLALYDGAIGQLIKAQNLLNAKDRNKAMPYLSKSQLIIMGLATVAPLDTNKELAENLLRLFEFCTYQISLAQEETVADAIKILQTLRIGYEAIRPEVAAMERCGKLARAESLRMVQGIA